MPAPDLPTFLAADSALVAAIVAALAAAGAPSPVAQFAAGALPVPRIEVALVASSPGEHLGQVPQSSPPQYYNDTLQGTLHLRCVTARAAGGGNPVALAGLVRATLSRPKQAITWANLPFAQVLRLDETGSAYAPETDTERDTLTLSYDFLLFLPPGAYPVG